MISAPFAEVLRAGRPEFNAQFAHARRQYPELDADSFSAFLRGTIDPWVRATHAVTPERTAATAMAGYEVAIELVGQRIAGPLSRYRVIDEGLARVLIANAAIVQAEPLVAIASFANALYQLATTPGARPADWIGALERVGPGSGSLEALLRLGQVAGWRAGLSHYRASALAMLDRLPIPLALAALGADERANFVELRGRLAKDPWFVPGRALPIPSLTGAVGAFRGFGGLFVEPPRVALFGSDILVKSGDEAWLLVADAFGATFHRASADEIRGARDQAAFPTGLRLLDGLMVWNGTKLSLPLNGPITSATCSDTTLAVTASSSHSVVLVAIGPST